MRKNSKFELFFKLPSAGRNSKLKVNPNELASGAAGLFVESNVHKKNNNRKNTSDDQQSRVEIYKQSLTHTSISSSSHTAITKKTIANTVSYVNNDNFAGLSSGIKLGVIITTPSIPADKFVQSPDKTLNQDLESLISAGKKVPFISEGKNLFIKINVP